MTTVQRLAQLITIPTLVFSLSACGGEAPADTVGEVADDPPAITASPNQELLDEVAAAESWFHAKKTKPIWARQVDEAQAVETLEGMEEVSPGDFLCRGEAGDIWPQKADKLEAKYQATDEVDSEGWRLYTPRPDAAGVLAAQVSQAFQVEATWGELSGKPGDFLVKSYNDKDVAYPEDVWIVDQALFAATYAKVDDEG